MLNRKVLIYNTIVFILFFFIYYKLYTDADHHITHRTPNSISKCKNKIINIFYFTCITHSTIGYGDFVPESNIAKLFVSIHSLLAFSGLNFMI